MLREEALTLENLAAGWSKSVFQKTLFVVLNYSETPPYGYLVITATFFWLPGKTTIHFLVKKPSLIRSPRYYGQIFFGPLVTVLTGFHYTQKTLKAIKFKCGKGIPK